MADCFKTCFFVCFLAESGQFLAQFRETQGYSRLYPTGGSLTSSRRDFQNPTPLSHASFQTQTGGAARVEKNEKVTEQLTIVSRRRPNKRSQTNAAITLNTSTPFDGAIEPSQSIELS